MEMLNDKIKDVGEIVAFKLQASYLHILINSKKYININF